MTLRIDDLEDMARVFHSLGDKTRVRMVVLLADGELNVTAVQKKLKLPQNSTSYHLNLLHIGGLLQTRRDGKQVFYSLADLSKHRLGQKPEFAKADSNAAKFGPAELILSAK